MSPFEAPRRIHFVGIGGAGMSAIAKVLLEQGLTITGSDLKRSRAATMLEAMGARIDIGHRAENVDDADIVVVSTAIPEKNPERRRATQLGVPLMSRGHVLAEVLEGKRSLVVAGTHGKTTTTSMAVSVARAAGLDPTYLVGGGLNDAGSNARYGRGEYTLAESDESDGSFLLLHPFVAVVTNIETDHVDYWASDAELRSAFERFIGQVHPEGAVVVPADDRSLLDAASRTGRRVVTFGSGGDFQAVDPTPTADGMSFLLEAGGATAEVHLRVRGLHNVANALAAAAACAQIGVDHPAIARGLADFRGVERRFQVRGTAAGVTVVDDYAHHPTEVRATLTSARPGPWERVVAVFQPHRYSRTAAMAADFGDAFGAADRVVITDIYGAGEQPVPGVSGKLVADAVCDRLPGRPVAYLPHRDELLAYLENHTRTGDMLLTLGAGDINAVGEELLARLGGRA